MQLACQGFQISSLKDKNGRIIYLFNDGSLKALEGPTALQSRFQIEFLYGNNVGFRNYFGKYLKAETMEWTSSEAGREETLSFEQSDQFVSFKSSDGAYLTVTDENDLTGTLPIKLGNLSELELLYLGKSF